MNFVKMKSICSKRYLSPEKLPFIESSRKRYDKETQLNENYLRLIWMNVRKRLFLYINELYRKKPAQIFTMASLRL